MTDSTITFVALREKDSDTRKLLCEAFYDQVYKHTFPPGDQAEDCETWLPLLEANAPEGKPRVHIILALRTLDPLEITQPHVLGGVVFEWYPVSDCWLITYLVVLPGSQGQGIGKSLIGKAADAIRVTSADRKEALPYIFAEAEDPERLTNLNHLPITYDRLLILEAFGFMRVDFRYVQPALAPNKRRLHDFLLLALTPPDEFVSDLAADRVGRFLDEFYQALDQPDAHELKSMRDSLRESERVQLLPLSPEVPIRYDKTLGNARSVTVQFLFFNDLFAIDRNVGSQVEAKGGAGPKRGITDNESLDLKAVRQLLRDRDPEGLLTPAESFHNDIVVPFISEMSMPLVVCCESFSGETGHHQKVTPPRPIWIDLPRSVKIEWESQSIRRVVANDSTQWISSQWRLSSPTISRFSRVALPRTVVQSSLTPMSRQCL